MTSDEELRLVEVAEKAETPTKGNIISQGLTPVTPRRVVQVAQPDHEISSRKRRRSSSPEQHLNVPAERISRNIFADPSNTTPIAKDLPSPLSSTVTPTPKRFKDFDLGLDDNCALAEEVLEALGPGIPGDTQKAVKEICNKHALRTQGIVKG